MDKKDLIVKGNIAVIGRLIDASNATLLAVIEGCDPKLQIIYKPIAGERPLWDFPDGNLAHREYAAYLLSESAGFDLVPFTALRSGPFGDGMVQEWIEIDHEVDVVEYGQSSDLQLRNMVLFDCIINNTDRKYGHLLLDASGQLKGCDHGVCFHVEDKLRTVLWQFSSLPLSSNEIELLLKIKNMDLSKMLDQLLTSSEIAAISARVSLLLKNGCFPEPSQLWPAIPWPPV